MSSRNFTTLSSSRPLLRFRIPPAETAFSLASPSGQPESPACSVVFSPSSSRLPLSSPSSHSPSIRTGAICAGVRANSLVVGTTNLRRLVVYPSTHVPPRQTRPRNAFIFKFNLSRSLSLSKGRRNRCQLFTAPGNISGGYSIGSGRALARTSALSQVNVPLTSNWRLPC